MGLTWPAGHRLQSLRHRISCCHGLDCITPPTTPHLSSYAEALTPKVMALREGAPTPTPWEIIKVYGWS